MAIHRRNLSASFWSFLKIQFPKEGNKTKVIGFLLRMQHLLRRKKYWKSQAKVVGSDDGWERRSHLLKRQGYKITRCGNNISVMFLLTSTILILGALSEAHVLSHLQPRSPTCLKNVTAAFEKAHIVPDVLPSFNPRIGIDTLFTDPVTDADVKVAPGILLTTEREFFQSVILTKVEEIKPAHPETDQPPQWSLFSRDKNLASSKSTWVITIVDPDALTPQNPSIAQFLHFMGQGFVVDHSEDLKGVENVQLTNVSSALVEFFHPSPPAGSDPHR